MVPVWRGLFWRVVLEAFLPSATFVYLTLPALKIFDTLAYWMGKSQPINSACSSHLLGTYSLHIYLLS